MASEKIENINGYDKGGLYVCELCGLYFYDLDAFDEHCQKQHDTVSILVVLENAVHIICARGRLARGN